MPGFLDLLRGGLDTVSTARAAKRQADTQDAEQSVNFLMRLQALQSQEAQRASEEAYRRAQITKLSQPSPARRRLQVGEDGSVSIINLDDPQDVKTVPNVKARIPTDPAATHRANRQYDIEHPLPVRPGVVGESPDIAATRRDLKDIQGQQIRAENQAKALKSEQRAYGTQHPRAAKGLGAARTAADSAAVNELDAMGAGIDSAAARAARLTRSADSTLNVLHQKRNGTGTGDAPPSFTDVRGGSAADGTAVADPDTFTDDEIASAIAAGAKTPEETIAHVTALRAKKKP